MQITENTDRSVAHKQELIIMEDLPKPKINKKKAIIIGISVFLAIGAIVGLVVGLYFHFQPQSTNLYTSITSTADGNTFLATKFQYTDKNMADDNVNQTFTVMFAGLNGSSTRRMLTTQNTYADATLHYQDISGVKFKIRNNKIYHVQFQLDELMNYIQQQQKGSSSQARLLQDQNSNIQQTYNDQNQMYNTTQIFNSLRDQIIQTIKNQYEHPIKVNIQQDFYYELQHNITTNTYNVVNSNNSRRLWSFGSFFHSVGHFFSNTFHKVKNFVKRDGPKILKYGALAALSAVDVIADPKEGIQHTIQNFKSGNIWQAVKNTGEDAANAWLPPYVSIPLDFVADTCFSHPPHLHCTWKGAENAAKKDILPYVQKHAVSTALKLFE